MLRIRASTIETRILPTAPELGFGLQDDWISIDEAKEIIATKRRRGHYLTDAEEAALLVDRDDSAEVMNVAGALTYGDQVVEERVRYWYYMALSQLLEDSAAPANDLVAVAEIYERLGHPSEMDQIVYWMPAAEGDALGRDALVDRWRDLVSRLDGEMEDRNF